MSKITQSAKGEQCTVRVSGLCINDPATTVAAHLNGGGMAMKSHDIHSAYACSACHAWLDGGYVKTHTREQRDLCHLQGIVETQLKLLEKELIHVD
jgi:hypothetical protein